ncbi:hypothetical protein H2200_008269 [Cladophialophora chaetospira]|uniref:Uncharacterized protein n=1 Tax=Cladophialophora chaetospira TaxID=386627 RepID=A0AA39CG96_9EURO|nr:hypothetical protein H2200_008269 [Cladophialophora chaetospira]
MFVTYTHPSQLQDAEKQQQVSSFAARRHKRKPREINVERKLSVRSPKGHLLNSHTWRAGGYSYRRGGSKPGHDKSLQNTDVEDTAIVLLAPLSNNVGGLREDSFDAYPIKATRLVKWAVDQYVNDVAVKSKDMFTDPNGKNWLMTYRWAQALQSDLLFEGLVLYTLCQLPPGYKPLPTLRESRLQYRASVLRKLRTRLSDPRLCTDDITLHTIIVLMGSDFHTSEDDFVEMHRSGLRQLVTMRGGLGGGEFDSMTRFVITSIEFLCDMAIKRRGPSKVQSILPPLELRYPRHPFPSHLSRQIARLPDGFRELIVALKMSVQTIEFLHQVAERVRTSTLEHIPWRESVQFGLMRVATTENATKLEQRICILVLVFERIWLPTTTELGKSRSLHGRLGQVFRERLQDCVKSMVQFEQEIDAHFMIWSAFVLVTIKDESKLSDEENKELMRLVFMLCPRQVKSWEKTGISLKRYFWSAPLMDIWHAKWLEANEFGIS